MVWVSYYIQKKGDAAAPNPASVYELQTDSAVTFEIIRRSFPLSGDFHFRAKRPAGGGRNYVWADMVDGDQIVHTFDNCIFLKVLQLQERQLHTSNPTSASTFSWDHNEKGSRIYSYFSHTKDTKKPVASGS